MLISILKKLPDVYKDGQSSWDTTLTLFQLFSLSQSWWWWQLTWWGVKTHNVLHPLQMYTRITMGWEMGKGVCGSQDLGIAKGEGWSFVRSWTMHSCWGMQSNGWNQTELGLIFNYQPWASCLISLNLRSVICRMETIPTSESWSEDCKCMPGVKQEAWKWLCSGFSPHLSSCLHKKLRKVL